jgi:hypothetical protein
MNAWLALGLGIIIGTCLGVFVISIVSMGRKADDQARLEMAEATVEEALREIDAYALEDPAWAIKTPVTRTVEANALIMRLRKILLTYSTNG